MAYNKVTLTDPFYIQTTEVTQSQFVAVVGYNPSANQGCVTCPVENVSYSAARMLGINPGTLRGRMKKLKISYDRSSHKKR